VCIPLVSSVERAAPALGLGYRKAVDITLPLVLHCDAAVPARNVRKEKRIRDLLTALRGQGLLDLDIAPPKQLKSGIDEHLLSLSLIGLIDCQQLLHKLEERCPELGHLTVREGRPWLTAGDAFKQVVAREEIAGYHKSSPRFDNAVCRGPAAAQHVDRQRHFPLQPP
jgi:hypothetical protein